MNFCFERKQNTLNTMGYGDDGGGGATNMPLWYPASEICFDIIMLNLLGVRCELKQYVCSL